MTIISSKLLGGAAIGLFATSAISAPKLVAYSSSGIPLNYVGAPKLVTYIAISPDELPANPEPPVVIGNPAKLPCWQPCTAYGTMMHVYRLPDPRKG